jgi:peptidoglycan DL-endopeptidase CwlO
VAHVRSQLVTARRGIALLTVATLGLGAAAALAPAASADPIADVRGHISAVQAQLDALNTKAEIVAEAYNGAQVQLSWKAKLADAASARLRDADRTVAQMRSRVVVFAASAYRSNGSAEISLLTGSDGPQGLLDRAATVEAVARWQRDAVGALAAAQRRQQQAKHAADAAVAAQRRTLADIASKRDQLVRDASAAQGLIGQLRGQEQQLVRAAQIAAAKAEAARRAAAAAAARKAAEQAAARAAELAREQAAAAAAARAVAAQQAQARAARPAPAAKISAPQVSTSGLRAGTTSQPPSRGTVGSGVVSTVLSWAYAQIGKPYVFGAAGPDAFDCSGLTMFVWAKVGVALVHYAPTQLAEGRPVAQSQLQPGDSVFFGNPIHHVGIYIGNGNMIDAPHTGASVRIDPVWWSEYAGAARYWG